MNKENPFMKGQETLTLHVRLEEVKPEERIKIDLTRINELTCQVYPWIKTSKLDIDKFGVILELIGVETPIKISSIETRDGVNIIEATTAGKKKITIRLFVQNRSTTAGFSLEEENETRRYTISYDRGDTKVTLEGRRIKIGDETIDCVYSKHVCGMTLSICDMPIFTIRIDKPNNMCDSLEVLTRSDEIIRYLVNLRKEDILSKPEELMFEVRKRFFVSEVYGTTAVHRR